MIHIKRPDVVAIEGSDSHPSEKGIEVGYSDFELQNAGTLTGLNEQVLLVLQTIGDVEV